MNIVILDFGHGTRKYTKGKQAPDGSLYEGEWSREVGKRIAAGLRECGFEVFEIINTDEDVPLQTRCNAANKIVREHPNDNVVFISVHINAAPNPGWEDRASGACVYVHPEASEKSIKLAQCYYECVKLFKLQGNRRVPDDEVWRANFKVLRSTNCPAILTENLFMTNHKEVKFLLSEEGKQTIENLHIAAVCKYFNVPCAVVTG